MRKYVIECSNPECPKKGDGPNGRLIIGKARIPGGTIEIRCRGCKKITLFHVCSVCGRISNDKDCRYCEEAKKVEQLKKIDNPRLRAILE